LDSFIERKDWKELAQVKVEQAVAEQSKELVRFLASASDYMVDEKVAIKDIGVMRQFLEPLKWENVDAHRERLGDAVGLLSKCFASVDFWGDLKRAHGELKKKYLSDEKAASPLEKEI